jgi:membrane protein required for colicin V production
MNTLDFILIALLIWGAIMGFRRGFFREAAAFFGLVIGIFLAIILSDIAGRVITGMVDWNPMPIKVLVFVLSFSLVVIGLWAIGASLTRLFKVIMLNMLNRLAGLVFGVLKTAMLVSVVFFFIRLINEQWMLFSDETFDNSVIYGMLEGLAPWLFKGLALF